MTQVSAERSSKGLPKLSMFASGLTVAKLVLRNPGVLKKLMVMSPAEPRYVRPPREYELPAYREGMKCCTSNEKYLRPTRWCNPLEPLVVAVAHELGAYELSDWEFAEAAYWFVKNKFAGEMVPLDSVSATLRRGTGSCMHLNSLWIALCRAAGIKARYKRFKALMQNVVMDLDVTKLMDLDETEQAMVPELVTAFQAFDPAGAHAEGEACIDSEWVVADVGMGPETQAYAGIPITKFGEDSIDATGWRPIPGTIERVESLPLAVGITMRLQSLLIPTVMERANVLFSGMVPLGRKIIEEVGGIEAYDQKARQRKELFATEEIAEAITRLTKDAKHRQVVEFEK